MTDEEATWRRYKSDDTKHPWQIEDCTEYEDRMKKDRSTLKLSADNGWRRPALIRWNKKVIRIAECQAFKNESALTCRRRYEQRRRPRRRPQRPQRHDDATRERPTKTIPEGATMTHRNDVSTLSPPWHCRRLYWLQFKSLTPSPCFDANIFLCFPNYLTGPLANNTTMTSKTQCR